MLTYAEVQGTGSISHDKRFQESGKAEGVEEEEEGRVEEEEGSAKEEGDSSESVRVFEPAVYADVC
jgi:hypothetical protein